MNNIDNVELVERAVGTVVEVAQSGPCVLWYWRHFTLIVEEYASERAAAESAWGIAESGTGSVEGVEFPDGHTHRLGEEWPVYDAVCEEFDEADDEATRTAAHTRHTFDIPSPFGQGVATAADPPSWLVSSRRNP